jgi:type I restriction-modification system DNA methylase subunit/restriction endonuclease S subunit
MITRSNLEALLLSLAFVKKGHVYEKHYLDCSCDMKVDIKKEKLIYPTEIKGRERNDGFNAPENFVVFECIDRLLSKGYRPEHIELEKKWHLGHDAKSGRADICVYDEEHQKMLFIIECKTYGKEYKKALDDTIADGGQLFSYWQQENATRWLALYASGFDGTQVLRNCPVINCSDDPNIIQLAKKDKSVKLYANAHTSPEKHTVWKETYSSEMHDNIILSDDTIAYKIGVKPLYKKDLKDFLPEDKIVNKFEEILRHNNVSDKENAFNRLIALFICKLVDEIQKTDDDVVEFQYKTGTDTYETLQDRLQKLHKEGMEKFMKEEIYYISDEYAEKLVQQYTGHKREKMIADLKGTLRILKFYTNNDFAFKDVHNEELFYQNGRILVEVVQLFQRYRIIGSKNLQFLGDLFEKLLNKGFKQNEGQFFTPIPIARFIWKSLPVADKMTLDDKVIIPKIIDYSCGAGHFLTEGVKIIQDTLDTITHSDDIDSNWVEHYIYGIEKDYRLARVSKISLFMHGAGDGNIIFGDGLDNFQDKGISNGQFDFLVANPPYSVSAFKQHMKLNENELTIVDKISNDGSEIETLFIERISQLVKANGIASVILPASILLNETSNSYIAARESLLRNFEIKAIVRLASKTFGETQTNTIILFLKKYDETPKRTDLLEDSVSAIFSLANTDDWEDSDILNGYIEKINVDKTDYFKFINEEVACDSFNKDSYFKMYEKEFLKQSFIKTKEAQAGFKRLTDTQKQEWKNKAFYTWVKEIEKEKMFYYALIYNQMTLVVTAPKDKKKQVKFLGYDWSKRKGQEGIQLLKNGGCLYSDADRNVEDKISTLIKAIYSNEMLNIKPLEGYYNYSNLHEMFDFDKVNFSKAINTNVNRKIKIDSKYKIKRLGECCEKPTYGASVSAVEGNPDTDYRYIRITDISDDGFLNDSWMTAEDIEEQYILKNGDFLFARTGATAGKTYLYKESAGKSIYAGYLIRFRTKPELLPEYLDIYTRTHYYLDWVDNYKKVNERPSLNANIFSDVLLPIPPTNIQEKIIDECHTFDSEYTKLHEALKESQAKISKLFAEAQIKASNEYKLSSEDDFNLGIGKRVIQSELNENGKLKVFSANVIESVGNIDKEEILSDYDKPSILWGIDGDWMVSYLEKNIPFYPTDHCGFLRVMNSEINPEYLAMLLDNEGAKVGFDRTNRASIERISALSLKIPDKKLQDDVIKKCKAYQKVISDSKTKMKTVLKKKEGIFESYIK